MHCMRIRILLFLFALSIVPRMVEGQPCYSGPGNTGIYSPVPSRPPHSQLEWTDHFIALTRIGNYFMPTFGDGDSMTEALKGSVPYGQSPPWNLYPFGSEGLRETYYIRRDATSGTAPFYRLFSPPFGDHIDTPDPADGSYGYYTEGIHGYPYTSQAAGTAPITRYFKGSVFDHRTSSQSPSDTAYALDATFSAGFGVPRYGFPRFNNCLDNSSVADNSSSYQYSLTSSAIRIDFNKVWGNAIGKLTHLASGRQLVTYSDAGSLIQAALFLGCCAINPTEFGGADGTWYSNTLLWAGSPILSASFAGNVPQSLTTTLRPLNSDHDIGVNSAGLATDPNSPLMWRGTFQKVTTLGYTIGPTTYQDVVTIRFGAALDADAPIPSSPYNAHQSFWLTVGVTAAEAFNTNNGVPTPVTFAPAPASTTGDIYDKDTAFIATTDTPGLSIGVMHLDPPAADTLFNVLSYQYIFSLGAWRLNLFTNAWVNLLHSTYKYDKVTMILGSLTDVRQRLRQVHCQETGRGCS